jgi:hypothetical protein
MKNCQRLLMILTQLLLVAGGYAKEVDEATGLIIDDNFELVKTICTGCHSAKNIIGQSGSRLTWLGMIRWMQNTQGLITFDADTEKKILDYLETNYAPKDINYRRANILPSLLPTNPYRTQASINLVGLEESYQTGEPLKVSLEINFQESYSKGYLDVWAALHLPNTPESQFYFLSNTTSFNDEPKSFLSSLESVDNSPLLMDFHVPLVDAGEYTFYVLLVERGTNPLNEADRNRSSLLIQTTNVR